MSRRIVERPEYVYENLDKLPKLLEELGKTQAEVAMESGLSSFQLSTWIYGSRMPCQESYNKLAEYLGWRLW